jgi:peptidyl-prolyl cis-trans isomerase D
MLNSFRRGGIVQFLMGVVVVMIIAAFALDVQGPSGTFQNECVVEVKGSCVAPRDFTAAFQLAVRPDLTAKEIKQLQIRKMLLDGLVERELLVEEARRLGISVSEEEVDAELALGRFHFSLPAERDGQLPMLTYLNVRHPQTEKFNYEIYQRVVRNHARMSSKDFKANQTEELIAARMRDLIKSGARISEAEAFAQYEFTRSKATVRVAQLHTPWFARFLTSVTDDAVRQYAAANAGDVDAAFAGQEATYKENCALVSEIFFGFPPAADAQDEAETKARAERVSARVLAHPEEFDTLARVHSTAPSAEYGGKRGCMNEADGEEVATQLTAIESSSPGSFTKLLELPRGYALLRVEARLGKDEVASTGRLWVARPLAARAAADQLTQKFARDLLAALGRGEPMKEALDAQVAQVLGGLSKAQPKTAARELYDAALESRDKPQVDVSPSLTRLGVLSPVQNAVASNAVKQLPFTLKAVGDVHPEPIPTRDGLAVLQLKDREPAKREDFDKEKAEFLRQLKERAQSDALTAFVASLRRAHEQEITVNEKYLDPKTPTQDDS